ncbi:MAG: hypothetical protein ACP5JG_16345 [Anaerolineae bacterium]
MPLPVESFQIREVHPIDIGSRRELFADGYLVYALKGTARLRLNRPVARELVLTHDAPWEGNTCGYHTVFYDEAYDGPPYRMFYRASHSDAQTHRQAHPQLTCYAESEDGTHWSKPSLGLVEFQGAKANNIVWDGVGTHNFMPFRDTNPACAPEAQYKAIGGQKKEGGLFAFRSRDSVHWSLMHDEPVVTSGAFDSQNVAFWDAIRGEYRIYLRDFRHPDDPGHPGGDFEGVRDIKTCTSADFIHWTEPVWLDYGDAQLTHLYTNQVMPYARAPHLYIGFPTRFVPDRASLTEGLFMVSRDGRHFVRWDEAIIPPGANPERWHNRSNYIWWGLVRTESAIWGAPPELSLYTNEHYYKADGARIRRYTYRQDGFVSVRADFDGGEVITKPLIFRGRYLSLNVATAAAGEVRVELQRPDGRPFDGYALKDSHPFYGDALDHTVTWAQGPDVGPLAGHSVRVRCVLRDANLYALQFKERM